MTKIERPIPHAARRLLCAQVLGIYLAMYWAPAALAAPTTPPASLAQVPEFLQQQPDPNVFVTVDNSGSMNAEFLPDSPGFPIATRMFPTPLSSPFAASGDGSPITTGLSFQGFAHAIDVARSRSATQNLMYYNPRLRYRPWVGTDVNGSPFTDANPNNALFNPYHPSRGGLNLVSGTINGGVSGTPVNSGEPAFTGSYTVPSMSGTPTFAVYYLFETANANCDGTAGDLDCYTRVEVVPSVATYTIATPNQRDEPGCTTTAGATVCSYAAEIQNFANWFQYYRSRTLLARGAMGHAMAALGNGFRVGFGLINGSPNPANTYDVDGFVSTTVRLGVRSFTGAHRTNFYGLLNNHDVGGATPSGRALYQVGDYFAWTNGGGSPHPKGPWADNPGSDDGKFAACRQSYHVYSTDGYWNENRSTLFGSLPAGVQNADNTSGPVICPPSGAPCYQYDPTKVSGSFSNALDNTNNRRYVGTEAQTLADIAMYFWYRDLQPGMPNIVAPSAANPAFWQNLSIMAVALALVGEKTGQGDTFLGNLDSGADNWPAVNILSPSAADDLWHAAINSRGRLLVANDPQELSARLAQALREIIERAASGTAATATTAFLEAGNGVFTAEFSQGTWTGNLYRREIDPATLQFKNFAGNPWKWRASDQLPAPDARRIFTLREDGSGVEFLPQSGSAGVSSSQMTELSSNPSATAADVIDYLRGDRSKERSAIPPGNLRDRPRGANSNVLGSIINSAPLYVKDDDFALDLLPAGTPGRDTYQAFVRANAGVGGSPGRTPLIWVGSNGGMFHAFNADTGVEVFAYVPRSIIRNLPELTKPDYQHRYFVDGVPASGDAYITPGGFGSPSWRTVVIGSLGAGGRSVFAIDATDPAALGAGSILWDLDETSLSSSSYQYLGHVFGPAFTARAKNGKWVAVFGNGPESDSRRAALFIVDLETGAPIRIIDTGDGSNGNPNGLSTPAPVFDANQQLIAVYAGDLRGNLWKFDLSSTNEASWDVAFGGAPLFKARNLAGQRQPIFARPLLRRHPNGGTMVIFGTGKLFSPGDKDNADVQTLYGVWDKPSASPLDDNFRSGSEMVQQAIKQKDVFDPSLAGDEPTNYRLTNFPVNYGAGKRGWYLDLGVQYGVAGTSVNAASATVVTPRERMVIPPIQLGINLLAQSFVPSTDPCSPGGDSFLYRLDPLTGSFFGERSFGDVDSGAIQVPGSFGLLPFYSRTASSAPPGTGGTQPPPPPTCPPGATCTCPPGFDYVFSTGIDGSISGRCVPRGGIGAVRTWRQIIQ
jgi:type IV pilus assembly protein PilY1